MREDTEYPLHNGYEDIHSPTYMVFRSSRRVDFPMVDLAGIMYYPKYWDLAHVFFEEIWEPVCGISYADVLNQKMLAFPLVHSEAKFHHPLRYGDTANCEIQVTGIGNTSITWKFVIYNQNGRKCWTATQTTVCTDLRSIEEKIEVPEWVREGLHAIAV